MVESRQAFDRDLREYNAANGITEGFTPVVPNSAREPSCVTETKISMVRWKGQLGLVLVGQLVANPEQASLSTALRLKISGLQQQQRPSCLT